MPRTGNPEPDHTAVVAYYRLVGPTLLGHLTGRPVTGLGAGPAPSVSAGAPPQAGPSTQAGPARPAVPAGQRGVDLHIADASDLDEAVRSGVVEFRLPDWAGADRLALHVSAGQDSGIDVVATTALALMELMHTDGIAVTVLLDGTGGMYLASTGAGQRAGARYARELADSSPEIATTSAVDTAGRALIEPLPADGGGLPAPYSLVDGPDGPAVIAPLTRDEVAAATAGMPLEIDRSELADRIRTRGDLAAQLTGPAGPDA